MMKYFVIRLSLVINVVLAMLFMCVDLDHTSMKNVYIFLGVVTALTAINGILLSTKYRGKIDEIITINNEA